jgi:redox-sensitive bicupin YhaK (pirin superfamily)
MEIITYVLEGSLEHKDSMARVRDRPRVQKMSVATPQRFNH